MPKISHPLYHDLATVSIRLTEMERHTPEEHQKHLFSFFPLLMCSETSLKSLLCGCLQVCKREFVREKKSLIVYHSIRDCCETDLHSMKKEREEDSQMRA